MIRLLFAGDFCFDVQLSGKNGCINPSSTLSIARIAHEVDYAVVNLECPLCSMESSQLRGITKQGPALSSDPEVLDTISALGFNAVTLANNHIFDYGDKALDDTLKGLEAKEIDYMGAGMTFADANRIFYKTISNLRFAFINCCEHEFSIVSEKHGGANPLEPIKQFYQIREAKIKADYVVVIIHGGVEHFQYPTPRMVNTYRFFIDAGADAVINHHQHCPCGFEEYKGKPIFYGLGNFFFPWQGKKNSIWNLGYLVKLTLDNNMVDYDIIPYRQCDDNKLDIKMITGDELLSFNEMMQELCEAIHDEPSLKEKLQSFNKENDYLYQKMLEPYSGRVMNSLYRRGLLPSFIGKERILALIDFLRCESHYERVLDYLDDKYKIFFNE